jgi:hypothetical protein
MQASGGKKAPPESLGQNSGEALPRPQSLDSLSKRAWCSSVSSDLFSKVMLRRSRSARRHLRTGLERGRDRRCTGKREPVPRLRAPSWDAAVHVQRVTLNAVYGSEPCRLLIES